MCSSESHSLLKLYLHQLPIFLFLGTQMFIKKYLRDKTVRPVLQLAVLHANMLIFLILSY